MKLINNIIRRYHYIKIKYWKTWKISSDKRQMCVSTMRRNVRVILSRVSAVRWCSFSSRTIGINVIWRNVLNVNDEFHTKDAKRRANGATNGGDNAAASERFGAVHLGWLYDGRIPATSILESIPACAATSDQERRQTPVTTAAPAALQTG